MRGRTGITAGTSLHRSHYLMVVVGVAVSP
jgi:hypothetical protein